MHIIIPDFTNLCLWVFPRGTSGKEPTCQSRRHKRYRFDPWVGKLCWRRKWQPTSVCGLCLENPMDIGAWRATVHRAPKSWARLKWLNTHAHMLMHKVWIFLKATFKLVNFHLSCSWVTNRKHLPLYSKSGVSASDGWEGRGCGPSASTDLRGRRRRGGYRTHLPPPRSPSQMLVTEQRPSPKETGENSDRPRGWRRVTDHPIGRKRKERRRFSSKGARKKLASNAFSIPGPDLLNLL